MSKKQFFGIKYPFTSQDSENYFIDVNKSIKDKVRSILMHVIFTPKGQKLRDPEFGTDLIKYIFDQNDSISWSSVKDEVSEMVKKYANGVTINNISILKNNDENSEIFVRLDYSITNGFNEVKDSIVTKI